MRFRAVRLAVAAGVVGAMFTSVPASAHWVGTPLNGWAHTGASNAPQAQGVTHNGALSRSRAAVRRDAAPAIVPAPYCQVATQIEGGAGPVSQQTGMEDFSSLDIVSVGLWTDKVNKRLVGAIRVQSLNDAPQGGPMVYGFENRWEINYSPQSGGAWYLVAFLDQTGKVTGGFGTTTTGYNDTLVANSAKLDTKNNLVIISVPLGSLHLHPGDDLSAPTATSYSGSPAARVSELGTTANNVADYFVAKGCGPAPA